MEPNAPRLNHVFAAACLSLCFFAGHGAAEGVGSDESNRLLKELADPEQPGWQQIEEQLRLEWSRSGSPSMDLLLQRGRKAIEEEDFEAAIEHLTALVDHAPDFAEGWNLRATAFFRAERFGLALEDIRRALALNPDHFAAMTGLGIILENLGQETDALEVFRRAATINPHREDVNEAIDRLERELEGKAI